MLKLTFMNTVARIVVLAAVAWELRMVVLGGLGQFEHLADQVFKSLFK